MKKSILNIFITLYLFFIPFIVFAYPKELILGGNNIGISINSDGILVVGFYKVNNRLNNSAISIGDYITKVNNIKVNNIKELVQEIKNNVFDDSVEIEYRHNNELKTTKLHLENNNGIYKTGLYVKDNIKGLGTLTYIIPKGEENERSFGALGHEIIDSETNTRFDIKDGSIFKAVITSITKSTNGNPGSKNANYFSNKIYGEISKNSNVGIYGKYTGDIDSDNKMEISFDANVGKAYIYTALLDNIVKPYEINILKVEKNNAIKNFYFEVTDKDLLSLTGGIVQGMSGSPIIQNNKIIGAVTHVAIDSVKNGYGVSIKNMLDAN